MSFQQITHDALEPMMADSDLIILDVRNTDSFEEGHIPNARHLSVEGFDAFCQETDKAKAVVVYCYHGISSQSIAQHLVEQGFTNVYSLTGGYEAWKTHHCE